MVVDQHMVFVVPFGTWMRAKKQWPTNLAAIDSGLRLCMIKMASWLFFRTYGRAQTAFAYLDNFHRDPNKSMLDPAPSIMSRATSTTTSRYL